MDFLSDELAIAGSGELVQMTGPVEAVQDYPVITGISEASPPLITDERDLPGADIQNTGLYGPISTTTPDQGTIQVTDRNIAPVVVAFGPTTPLYPEVTRDTQNATPPAYRITPSGQVTKAGETEAVQLGPGKGNFLLILLVIIAAYMVLK